MYLLEMSSQNNQVDNKLNLNHSEHNLFNKQNHNNQKVMIELLKKKNKML
jgi:hypothetical protein